MKIIALRHSYPEHAGFSINRGQGRNDFTFLHFFNSVDLLVNGDLIRTKPHACILFPPNVPQYFLSHERLIHDWMHFTEPPQGALERFGLQPNTVYYPQNHEKITHLIRETENEFFSSYSNREEMLVLKWEEIFITLSRCVKDEYQAPVADNLSKQLRGLREELLLRLNEPWTVEKMAQRVNLSVSRFFHVYKALFGISPTNDLISARITAAKNVLLGTEKTIGELASELGYHNVSHFIRQFKQIENVSPMQYRNKGKTFSVEKYT